MTKSTALVEGKLGLSVEIDGVVESGEDGDVSQLEREREREREREIDR